MKPLRSSYSRIDSTWNSHTRNLLILCGILLAATGIRIVLFSGVTNIDTLAYASNAYDIASGHFNASSTHVHALRTGLTLPTALLYRLFGASDIVSGLYPFFCSLASIVLIFAFSTLLFRDEITGLISAGLLAVFPQDIFYASQFMPEVPLSFLMGLCVYFFLKGEFARNRQTTKWYYLAAGITAGFAYTTKIFAVFLVLFVLSYILYTRKLPLSYLWGLLGFCSLFLLEMAFYYAKTGNPLHHITAILFSPGGDFDPNPGGMYKSDLYLYPYYWFISLIHFGFFYYGILGAVAYSLWYRLKATYIPMIWAGSLFLYLQFGREGKYLIHKEARFLSILTIPCLLVLGYVLGRFYASRRRTGFWLIIGSVCVTSLGFASFQNALERSEFNMFREIAGYMQQLPAETPLYTDNETARYLTYFMGYPPQGRVNAFNVYHFKTGKNTYPIDLRRITTGVVIVNWHLINTLKYKGITSIIFPEILYDLPSNWELQQTIIPPQNWVMSGLRMVQENSLFSFLPVKITRKISKTLDRVLRSHQENTLIYRVRGQDSR